MSLDSKTPSHQLISDHLTFLSGIEDQVLSIKELPQEVGKDHSIYSSITGKNKTSPH